MSIDIESLKKTATRESLLFLYLLLTGVLILPIIVYIVGKSVFGEYGGTGFSAFYGTLHSDFRSGEFAVWFLMLSPYIVWQLIRLTIFAFRRAGKRQQQANS